MRAVEKSITKSYCSEMRFSSTSMLPVALQ